MPKTNESLPRLLPGEIEDMLGPLRAGVVPRTGFEHFSVGRSREVAAVLADVGTAARGRSAVRVVVGPYGSGKSFMLALARSAARRANLATTTADLSPDRRFYGGDGTARALYAELARNITTAEAPGGPGMPTILDRILSRAQDEASSTGADVEKVLDQRLTTLQSLNLGFAFADVVRLYARAGVTNDATMQGRCLRWLRGEYTSRTHARSEIGLSNFLDDRDCWDAIKVVAALARLGGFDGLLICVDELVNIQKLPTARARKANLEQILKILNDCLQTDASGLVVYLGATPEALEDQRTGLFSYDALRTRLAPNSLALRGTTDERGPVLRLAPLTPEEGYVLLARLRHVKAGGDEGAHLLPDEGLRLFLESCYRALGAAAYQTPRDMVIQFINLLDALESDPEGDWRDLARAAAGQLTPACDDDDFDDFDLEATR